MADFYKYRVWCEVDNQWEYEWLSSSDPLPSVCPVNAGHAITLSRTVVVEVRAQEDTVNTFVNILDKDLATPPGSPSNGDRYIVAAGATGIWSGKDNQIVEWSEDESTWICTEPVVGVAMIVEDEGEYYRYNGSTWELFRTHGSSGNVVSSYFTEVSALVEKSGSSWGQLLTLNATPSSANSSFIVIFDASMEISTNSDRKIDFRLVAGSGSGTERRGTYASSDKTTQIACAALSSQFSADDATQHVFTIEWRIRSGSGAVSIDPPNNIHNHASMLVQEVR
jgi:hypothetical protein